MLFRSKFAWVQLAGALLWMGLCLRSFHEHTHDGIGQLNLLAGTLQLLIAVSCVAHYFFAWWQVNDAGLTQRRLWSTRTIPWSEITRIGPWQPNNRPNYQWLAVEYARPAPLSDRGELLIQPADRNALVRALRSYAPQAEFDFFPLEI